MTFLHMHHAMANKATMQAKYTEGLADKPASCAERIRELVMSGAVDYRDRFQPVEVTNYDRLMVIRYLSAHA